MFTNGYELTTAITNLIICAMSLYCLFKSKNKLKVWTVFYIVISIASFLGFIYHGIILNEEIKEYIWKVLTFMFCIGINSLLVVALNEVKKLTNKKSILSVFIMSFVLFVMFMLLEFNNIDSFGYYKGYCAVSMIGMLLFYIIRLVKNKKSYLYYYISALVINIIGGIFLVNDNFKILYLDKNGIYHMFLVLTIYLFYKGNKLLK